MKVYVAGASAERADVAKYMQRLRDTGIEVALDWAAEIDANGGLSNEGLTEKQRLGAAVADRDAVLCADVLWLMVPRTASVGAWVELGVAIGANVTRDNLSEIFDNSGADIMTVVSGAYDKSIFTALADRVYNDHEAAYEDIVRMVQR